MIFIDTISTRLDVSGSKGYESEGGYFYEEAIMLLRKFYVRENKNGKEREREREWLMLKLNFYYKQAPIPRKKINRILKTEIVPKNQQ